MSEASSSLMRVAVVTPEGSAFEGEARSVVVPAYDGEIAFLPGHAAFVGTLGVGELRVEALSGPVRSFVEGGVVQVADGVVTVLAESVLPIEKIDTAAAAREVEAALAETPTSEEAFDARDKRLAAARAKLRIAAHT